MIKDSTEKIEELFTKYITVESISEELKTVSEECDVKQAKNIMETNNYDILGIEDSSANLIIGYIEHSDIQNGTGICKSYKRNFPIDEIVSINIPLAEAISILQNKERLFVFSKNTISGIVTRADLQKQPVRLFIFGFISLLEMHLLEIIRKYFPNESWKRNISKDRLKDAMNLYTERKKRNEEIDLDSCLQLADKREIIGRNKELLSKLGFESKKKWEKEITRIENIRNKLAHSQELEKGFGPSEIIKLQNDLKGIIEKCKELEKPEDANRFGEDPAR
jgi:predicted transcriptional regulator